MSNMEFSAFNDNNVKYTGTSSNNLDINQGESLGVVIDKLVVALSNLVDRVNSCSFCEGEDNELSLNATNISTSSSTSQNSTITTSKPISVKTIPNSTGVGVNFDLNEVIGSLGGTVIKAKTSIIGQKNGAPSNIVSSNKESGTVNLRPDNFPASLESEIRYQDASGEKTVSIKIPLSSTNSEINLPLQGSVIGIPEINNQEDLNQNLQERVLNIENAITSLNNVNISGFNGNLPANSTINQTVAYLLSEIETIKSSLSS